MRKFVFTWQKVSKYDNEPICHNVVSVNHHPDANIGIVAKNATDVFKSSFGNLKKNRIISIQEIDENGTPIGEAIIPDDDTSIVPTKK